MRISISSLTAIAFATLVIGVAAAEAQTSAETTAAEQQHVGVAPSARTSVGIRAFAAIDVNALAAQNSFNAVLGTSRLACVGGGADVLNVWKSAFVRVAVSHVNRSGNRAFVFNGQPISLGVPITISMTPIEIGGGWRVGSARSRVTPYAGAGALLLQYSETSSFASGTDNVSQQNHGYTAFGGVELAVTKWFMAGVEAQYRSVPNAIGAGSVSQDFHESDLGGFTARILAGIRR